MATSGKRDAAAAVLRSVRVVDLSAGIAGGYATKLFADAGADVVKVEPPGGDPLRRHSATGADLGSEDGALFRFLHAGKRSVVGEPESDVVRDLIRSADLVVESFAPERFDAESVAADEPGLVVLSITPYGRTGPWRNRPWTELTLQAESGSIGTRGLPGREPFQAGGRITEWVGGTYAGVAALAAVSRARKSGHGEHVDFSLFEAITLAGTNFMELMSRLLGWNGEGGLPQNVETPSIEPTRDGYVGFCTNSRQQIADFMALIERPELADDPELTQVFGRSLRFAEWNEIVHAFTKRYTTDEILERAAALRIPSAPVLNARTVRDHEQVVARGMLQRDATGSFWQPRRPYRFDDVDPPPPRPAPGLGEHQDRIDARTPERPRATAERRLPLEGIRIVDLTAWWAGPSATQMLATLGADVIHVESPTRGDAMRMTGGMVRHRFPAFWEASAVFACANSNKRGLTLDLRQPRARELALRLIAVSDGVFDNHTPRVLESFGLDWPGLQLVNPRLILVRMPAFGLSGPWRDHTGFAQTMEQLTGLAWITGHPDDQPRIQRGPCDPLSGMHGAWAFLLALAERDSTGRAVHVESTMVEAALNAAAEPILEESAYGRLLERAGNRSPTASPQGLYACAGSTPGNERWLALSIESEAQWAALVEILGSPPWATADDLREAGARRAAQDRVDCELRAWAAEQDREKILARLLAAGVPAAPVVDPRRVGESPQHRARGFFETVEHAVLGAQPFTTVPFRFGSVERWLRRPAPMLGEDNRQILVELLGLDPSELEELEASKVIGTRLEA
ncbi:MAG: CoA transferase [Deltaproteobacteria bacterium]|nr:CoA transferase [Deltaproteobacteria bacterium]